MSLRSRTLRTAGTIARRLGVREEQLIGLLKAGRRFGTALRSPDHGELHRTLAELSMEFPGSRTLRRAARFKRPKPTVLALTRRIDRGNKARALTIRTRLRTVLRVLDPEKTSAYAEARSTSELLRAFESALQEPTHEQAWLALAVLGADLPEVPTVLHATRIAALDGALAAFLEVLWAPRLGPTVRVIADTVLVDLHHTARTNLATGIQRVARQSAQRWHRDNAVTLVGWSAGYTMLRELDPTERERALTGVGPEVARDDLGPRLPQEVLVPWRCTFLLPELATEHARISRINALLRFSHSVGGAIGFDCVPISTAETVGGGMGAAFANVLSALAFSKRITTISLSAGNEYRGWRRMLGGAGLSGPEIEPILLPVEATTPSAEALVRAREMLVRDDLPMVLCVGSHEPRKNHGAVLHAATLLWRSGVDFSLVFVGGNSWSSEGFHRRIEDLQAEGRPVLSLTALDDDLLWASYELAHCVIFPSLNEGFGLPVAEALATGTPVITSNFGSMREIADEGGALMVDPRSDNEIRDALEAMLTDEALYVRLLDEAKNRSTRTWEQYAAETWSFLVEGQTA